MAGADGQIYSSEDYGETWVNEGEDLGVSSDIYAINQTSTALMVGGTDGCLMRKPVAETKNVWGIERSGFFNGQGKWAKGFENQMV